MKVGYKNTELGLIPNEWNVKNLKEIVDICYGKSQKEVEIDEGKYKILGTGGVIGRTNDYLWNEPSVLIGRKGTIDKPQYIEEPFWTVDTLFYTKLKNNNSARWLFYYMNYIDLKKYNEATGVPSLSVSNLNCIKICTPPIKEQQNIVDILSTVDSQIDNTDKFIEKTKELKKGLMQRLLTKGIDHNEFKKSELGEIPVEWEVKNIDEVAKRYSGHTPDKKIENYWNGDIPWISLKDTKKLDNRYIHETEDYTTEDGINNSSAVILPKNTVVLSRDATIGKVGITSKEMATSQHFINYVCGFSLDSLYLYYDFLNKKQLFERIGIGSTIKTIGLSFFKELKIVIPPIEEQKQIANILSSVDNQIEEYENKKIKLEELKKGLMQQLLTGNIRIK